MVPQIEQQAEESAHPGDSNTPPKSGVKQEETTGTSEVQPAKEESKNKGKSKKGSTEDTIARKQHE